MARDLDEHGPRFLQSRATSQSLSLSDILPRKMGLLHLYLRQAVKDVFLPYFDGAIWFQNSSLYHFSMFHASHHVVSVPVTQEEIEIEANSVKAIADGICLLEIVLDRVVFSSTGVLLGCWQEQDKHSNQLQLFHELVEHLNNRTPGTKAVISELWYVEEFDVLALALDGKMKPRHFTLGCSKTSGSKKL